MRATWITLVLIGVVPAVLFLIIDAAGVTNCLRYIATTTWRPADPSLLHLAGLAVSITLWVWLRVGLLISLLAALPFAAVDLVCYLRFPR